MYSVTFVALLLLFISICQIEIDGYIQKSFGKFSIQKVEGSTTKLFAHHPQKKIIKRKQDRRPKKHRLSDINRTNVNLNKCITKVENAPADYTLISAEDYLLVREKALRFWEDGDSEAEWLEITAEDMMVTFSSNTEPLPVGGVQKRPPLVKSGTV